MQHNYSLGRGWLVGLLVGLAVATAAPAQAQDDILGQLEEQAPVAEAPSYVEATFKSTRLISGHTVQTPGQGTLIFLIAHRFGALNGGAYNFFGLDQAETRLGLEYGVTDLLTVGVGRSSENKMFDGFLKYKTIRQRTGVGGSPVTVTLFGSTALSTQRYSEEKFDRNLTRRSTYTGQALIARKFSPELSLQLMPTFIHRNLVTQQTEPNDIYALGLAGRQKLTKRTSVNVEYYYLLPETKPTGVRNALAIGLDLETGGHVFQLHVANSQGLIEKSFIGDATGNFFDGDIYFGFIVNRNFTIRPKSGFRK